MPKQKIQIKEGKIKVFYNEEVEDLPFPLLTNYENIQYRPRKLADINQKEGKKLDELVSDDVEASMRARAGLDTLGNLIKEVINTKLNTSTKQILSDFTFGISGAIKIPGDGSAGVWISPTGILGRNTAGATTFALNASDGSAVFSGTVYASAGVVAGSIVSSGISAGNITTGTLTGRTIRTAVSGQRIELQAADAPFPHEILIYNLYGTNTCRISGGAAETVIIGSLDIYPVSFMGPFGHLGLQVYETKVLSNHLQPVYSNRDLGISTNKWRHLHLSGSIYVDGTVDGVDVSAHAANASAHHTRYTDSEARAAMAGHTITMAALNTTVGIINYNGVLFMDFYDYTSYGVIVFRRGTGTAGCDLLPTIDGAGQIGYRAGYGGQASNRRWGNIHGQVVMSGDLGFENNFRFTEEEEVGIALYNAQNEKIAVFMKNGDIYVRGRVIEGMNEIFTTNIKKPPKTFPPLNGENKKVEKNSKNFI